MPWGRGRFGREGRLRDEYHLLFFRHDQRRARHGARDIGVALDQDEASVFEPERIFGKSPALAAGRVM